MTGLDTGSPCACEAEPIQWEETVMKGLGFSKVVTRERSPSPARALPRHKRLMKVSSPEEGKY